jgi:PadR family transcriptional regulator PadR
MAEMTDSPRRVDLLQGTLDMLILKALTAGTMHGYGVARWLERTTENTLRVEEGSLYPALTRMAERGWVSRAWGISENNRRARFYSLTAEGERQLQLETATWSTFTGAVARVLDSEPG